MEEDQILTFSWVENDNGESADIESRTFARLLISGTIEHISEIDGQIKDHLSDNWDFNRLNKVTLAILRMSVYSLLYQKDLPATIVIDEAIDIAKEYGPDESFKFINALLDTVKNELGKAGAGSV
jgi:N utilization substance protein B